MMKIAAHVVYIVILSATIAAGIALLGILIAQWHRIVGTL